VNWYEYSSKDLEEKLQTNCSNGLQEEIASKRLQKVGLNQLQEAEQPSMFLLFLAQFKDFMVLVLLAATLISGLLGEYVDAIAIMTIVLINGLLGFFQERKAEKSLEALKNLSAPQVHVLREGEWKQVLSQELTVGDVIKFTSGDRVGADVRVIKSQSLEIEESSLTGESVPVQKHNQPIYRKELELGDQDNMAFMGTLVTRGSGVGIVVATGMNTAMGKIADLLHTAQSVSTPLQRRLEQLGKVLISAALLLTLLVVVIGVYQGHDLYNMFLAGVSLAVAAIPEGLPAIVTVALSLGVQRMIKNKAIVRKLPAVETLGCASVICSDKTGTMTQNKMSVTRLWAGGEFWQLTGVGYHPKGDFLNDKNSTVVPLKEKSLSQLLTFGLLCNGAEVKQKDNDYVLDGDPTEGALVVSAMKAGLSKEMIQKQFRIVKEFPFDSTRKMMSMLVEDNKKQKYIVAKGAPDVLLNKSDFILWNDYKHKMTSEKSTEVMGAVEALANQALRTIAVAFRPVSDTEYIQNEIDAEKEFIFVGVQGMIDPPRPEVKLAIDECRQAGIKTIMITGDHVTTAKAIAQQLNIIPTGGKVLDGYSLSKMTNEQLVECVDDVYVFARVSPEHKLKIVKALQQNGHVVAMTGDGVNDAPAIKAADIGVAMGQTGTDVAKEASDLVLLDDNFATIKAAIKEGRNIYENIRKFIRYMLASNVGEILVMLFAMILGLPLPLVPIQILWVNLVTDGLPAMALGVDNAESNVMKRDPRSPNEGVFSRGLGWKIISRGFLIGVVSLAAFIIVYSNQPNNLMYAQTVAFATLVMAQLIHVFDCRSERSVYHRNPFENIYLVLAVLSSVALLLVVIYYPPLQPIFHTVALLGRDWLLILGLASLPTFLLIGTILKKENRKFS
jgi:P-type Ca2+ transporter type 2C